MFGCLQHCARVRSTQGRQEDDRERIEGRQSNAV